MRKRLAEDDSDQETSLEKNPVESKTGSRCCERFIMWWQLDWSGRLLDGNCQSRLWRRIPIGHATENVQCATPLFANRALRLVEQPILALHL
jgi:hypothetical protein